MKLPFYFLMFIILVTSLVTALPRKEKIRHREKHSFGQATNMTKPGLSSVELTGTSKGPHADITSKLYPNSQKYEYERRQSKVSRSAKRAVSLDVDANKRIAPPIVLGAKAIMTNPKIQEAVVEKGIEVAGKLVDKQLQIIDDAQQKASDFLKKEIKLDITPDKGWESEDMFVPPGYHIGAAVEGAEESPKEVGETPYVFPTGLGGVLMNGCWGTDYKQNDPCYQSKETSGICTDMIDGAAFLGVGFDLRGKYSPESRKMSIAQRNCINKATYDGLDVPDTMNVHGIYDTSASLVTFESREEYRKFLQEEAGVSGSFLGFSAGVKEAWGESTQSSRQKYMAVMDVDVDRYEIFMDEVKPKDLSLSFLREFMALPLSYFSAGGPLDYQNFIQRWGTHFIKSAKFGGQLEIRKTMDAMDAGSKKEFEVKMEMEYKTLFGSIGAKKSKEEGSSERVQTKTTSTSVVAQGGSQDIASILSDVYSPTFKTEFKEWLRSIPSYPKAFRFQMGSITDLLNFRANDLFLDEKVNWGCEGNAANLRTEEKDGKTVKYYELVATDGTKNKYYCEFDNRQDLEEAIQGRRTSLQRAIEIYMEEGAFSISNIELGVCERPNGEAEEVEKAEEVDGDFGSAYMHPSWKQITKGSSTFRISFDMLDDLPSSLRRALDIKRNTSRLVRFFDKNWHTSDQNGVFHLYGIFDNGESKILSQRKMSILGLVLTYDEDDGSLVLSPKDYKASKRFFPTLGEEMTGIKFARLEMTHGKTLKRAYMTDAAPEVPPEIPLTPCSVDWSNALRIDPTDKRGKCLHFTASAEGSIFVVFAALPKDESTWYYVEISPTRVATYKGTALKTSTANINARALGDASLYQSYFVCITESPQSTLIEYGKSLGSSDSGDVYLNLIDSDGHLNVRFYAFGNDEKPAKVMDAHLVSRATTKADCKGDTKKDIELDVCVQDCHKDCDPLAGCKVKDAATFPDGCNACRVALDVSSYFCIPECPSHKTLTSEKTCVPTFDVLLKHTANFDAIQIDEIPTLHELTICMWLKLEGTWGNQIANHIYLVRYVYDNDKFFNTKLEGTSTLPEGGIIFLFEVPNSGSQSLEVNDLADGNWHQICVTWSGLTGVAVYYRNGNRVLSYTYTRSELAGGGKLSIGGVATVGGGIGNPEVTIDITGVNLWNRILSEQEITKNAEKCDGGIGNTKPWHAWYDVAKATSGYLRETSQCEAPTPPLDQE